MNKIITAAINAENLIDLGIEYIGLDTEYRHASAQYNIANLSITAREAARKKMNDAYKAEQAMYYKLDAITDVTGIPFHTIHRASRIALRWFGKTKWQCCLWGNADRLLQFCIDEANKEV